MKLEWIARLVLIGLLGLIPAGLWWASQTAQVSPAIEMHASVAETGGFAPSDLSARVGEPLHLRLTSDDVVHGIAIGQSDQAPVDILPGEWSELNLSFERPGRYVYYCTRWCGPGHWRMRGTIQVSGEGNPVQADSQPLYLQLGIDLDAPVEAYPAPLVKPSATRGRQLGIQLPARLTGQEYLRTHSPWQLFQELRSEALGQHLSDAQVWDLVAYAWSFSTSPERLADGRQLYQQNCAACHGETGRGDGVYAGNLSIQSTPQVQATHDPSDPHSMEDAAFGHSAVTPADFGDLTQMFARSPARLQGKTIRGGMGTGMPYWGPIFTSDQTWMLAEFLWTFSMDIDDQISSP